MSVIVPTKDVGETRVVFRRECEVVRGLEDFNEDYIKSQFGVME